MLECDGTCEESIFEQRQGSWQLNGERALLLGLKAGAHDKMLERSRLVQKEGQQFLFFGLMARQGFQ